MSLKDTLAYTYLKNTNLTLRSIFRREKDIAPSAPFKEYPNAPRVKLEIESFPETSSLFQILAERRSKRNYRRFEISKEEISLLCFATQGVTAIAGSYLLRTAPSAGALYPIETYLAVNFSSEIAPGLYHLNIREFSLERLAEGYFGDILKEIALGQAFLSTASVVFIWSAVLRRTMSKYGERGLRYVFLDCGHICQNLLLACTALGLKACPVGAFFDEDLNDLLHLDGEEETVIYLATIGK